MKKYNVFRIVGLSIVFTIGTYAVSTSDYDRQINGFDFTQYGFANPLDNITGRYIMQPFYSSHYVSGYQHTGVDFEADSGDSVYSICNGKVVENQDSDYQRDVRKKNNYRSYLDSRIVIQCNENNNKFLTIYGHVKNSSVYLNEEVYKGQKIAEITEAYYSGGNRYTANDHLHFGINVNDAIPYGSGWGWGIAPGDASREDVENKGFRDAFEYLSSLSLQSIFDGAGSIVASDKQECIEFTNGYGCDRDIAYMHPHDGRSSTVVFQWKYNKNSCKYLYISTSINADFYLRMKNWESHLIQKIYRFNGSDGIVIDNMGNTWNTLAVTSSNPIDSDVVVYANCINDKYYPDNVKEIAVDNSNKLVDMTLNYYWSGTSSVIAYNKNDENYGINKDIVVVNQSHKTLATTQWLATDKCKSVTIYGLDISGTHYRYDNALGEIDVSIKEWYKNMDGWQKVSCNSLPCTINRPGEEYAYYIIKYKLNPTGKANRAIYVKCK